MSAWKTMDSAPKDTGLFIAYGSYLYGGDGAPTEYYDLAEWDTYEGKTGWWSVTESAIVNDGYFTHWLPLPSPPAS